MGAKSMFSTPPDAPKSTGLFDTPPDPIDPGAAYEAKQNEIATHDPSLNGLGDLRNRSMRGLADTIGSGAQWLSRMFANNPAALSGPGTIPAPKQIKAQADAFNQTPEKIESNVQADPVYQWGKGVRENSKVAFPTRSVIDDKVPFNDFVGNVVGMGAAAVTPFVGLPAVVASVAQTEFERAKAEKATDQQAYRQGLVAAGITGMLVTTIGGLNKVFQIGAKAAGRTVDAEATGIRAAFNKWLVENPGSAAYAETILRQAGETTAQGFLNDAAAKFTYGSTERNPLDPSMRAADFTGGFLGGAMFGGLAAEQAVAKSKAKATLDAADNARSIILSLADEAKTFQDKNLPAQQEPTQQKGPAYDQQQEGRLQTEGRQGREGLLSPALNDNTTPGELTTPPAPVTEAPLQAPDIPTQDVSILTLKRRQRERKKAAAKAVPEVAPETDWSAKVGEQLKAATGMDIPVEVASAPENHSGIGYDTERGVVQFDPAKMAQHDPKLVDAMIGEEGKHAVQEQVVKDLAAKEGKTADQWWTDRYNEMTPQERQMIAKARGMTESPANTAREWVRFIEQRQTGEGFSTEQITRGMSEADAKVIRANTTRLMGKITQGVKDLFAGSRLTAVKNLLKTLPESGKVGNDNAGRGISNGTVRGDGRANDTGRSEEIQNSAPVYPAGETRPQQGDSVRGTGAIPADQGAKQPYQSATERRSVAAFAVRDKLLPSAIEAFKKSGSSQAEAEAWMDKWTDKYIASMKKSKTTKPPNINQTFFLQKAYEAAAAQKRQVVSTDAPVSNDTTVTHTENIAAPIVDDSTKAIIDARTEARSRIRKQFENQALLGGAKEQAEGLKGLAYFLGKEGKKAELEGVVNKIAELTKSTPDAVRKSLAESEGTIQAKLHKTANELANSGFESESVASAAAPTPKDMNRAIATAPTEEARAAEIKNGAAQNVTRYGVLLRALAPEEGKKPIDLSPAQLKAIGMPDAQEIMRQAITKDPNLTGASYGDILKQMDDNNWGDVKSHAVAHTARMAVEQQSRMEKFAQRSANDLAEAQADMAKLTADVSEKNEELTTARTAEQTFRERHRESFKSIISAIQRESKADSRVAAVFASEQAIANVRESLPAVELAGRDFLRWGLSKYGTDFLSKLDSIKLADLAAEYQADPSATYKKGTEDRVMAAIALLKQDSTTAATGMLAAIEASKDYRGTFTALESHLAKEFERSPGTAIQNILAQARSKGRDIEAAYSTWFKAQRRFKALEQRISDSKNGLDVATKFLKDEEWNAHYKSVLEDAKLIGMEHPGNPTDSVLGLPDGKILPIMPLEASVSDQATFEKYRERVQQGIDAIDMHLAENPDAADRAMWERRAEMLKTYVLNLDVLKPNGVPMVFKLGFDALEPTVEMIGGRYAEIIKPLVSEYSTLNRLATEWLGRNRAEHVSVMKHAMQSHGLSGDFDGVTDYAKTVANELWYSWQGEKPKGLGVGDTLLSGKIVTRADMDALEFVSRITSEAYDKILPGTVIKDTFGDTMFRQALKLNKHMVSRQFDNAARAVASDIAHAVRDLRMDGKDDFSKLERLLYDNIDHVLAFINDRNPEFASVTAFDGIDGAFKALRKEVADGIIDRDRLTFDDIVGHLARISGESVEKSKEILLGEIIRVFKNFDASYLKAREAAKESKTKFDIKNMDPNNEFTQNRGRALLPYSFYDYGMADTPALLRFQSSIYAAHQAEVVKGLKKWATEILPKVKADLTDATKRLVAEHKSRKAPIKSSDAAKRVIAKRREEIRKYGTQYDSFDKIDEKIKAVNRVIDNIESDVHDSLMTNPLRRTLGLMTGMILTSSRTTLGNITYSPLFSGIVSRNLAGVGSQGWQIAKAIEELYTKTLPAAFWHMGSAGLRGVVKGGAEGLANVVKGRVNEAVEGTVKQNVHAFFRPILHELAEVSYQNMMRKSALLAEGKIFKPEFVKDFDAKFMTNMRDGGMLLRHDWEQGGALKKWYMSMVGTGEVGLAMFSSWMNPFLGDIALNKRNYEYTLSSDGPIQRTQDGLQNLFEKRKDDIGFRFSFDNLTDRRNIITPEELFTGTWVDGVWKKYGNETDMAKMIQLYTHAGIRFHEEAVRYIGELAAGKKDAQFLTDAQRDMLAHSVLDRTNRPNAANTPGWLRSQRALNQLAAPFMGYRMRMLSNVNQWLGVKGNAKYAPWAVSAAMAATLVPSLLIGAAAQNVIGQEFDRYWKYFIYGKEKANRMPWEFEDGSKQAQAWALLMTGAVPFADMVAATMLTDTAARGRHDFSLVSIQKAKDLAKYLGGVLQTGDPTYKLPEFIGGMIPDTKIILNRLDSQAGKTELTSANNLLRRYGDPELIKSMGSPSGVNATPLSPYGDRLANAAIKGDLGELQTVFNETVEVARAMGRDNPERVAMQMLESRNPIQSVFKTKPTDEQMAATLARMSAGERAAVESVQAKYSAAIESLGGKPVQFTAQPRPAGGGATGGGGAGGGGGRSYSLPPSMRPPSAGIPRQLGGSTSRFSRGRTSRRLGRNRSGIRRTRIGGIRSRVRGRRSI